MFSILISSVLVLLTTIIIYTKIYLKFTFKFCKSIKSLKSKTAIVTGGTSGMGYETAKDFARRGAKVIIAGPFDDEGKNAREDIVKATGNDKVIFKLLDLASLKSVREFAEDVLKDEDRLDILINNAGVGIPGDYLTSDGLHFVLQVNYFGHFLLSLLLLPLLKKTGAKNEPSRIVMVSSELHKYTGAFDMDKLNKTGCKNRLQIYGTSKLCMILFAREFAKKLKDANINNVVVNSLQPGTVHTNIYQSVDKPFVPVVEFSKLFMKTAWEGCQTALFLALDDEAGTISGEYFENCKLIKARKLAYDEQLAKDLWDESVRLVKIDKGELEQCLGF